MIRIRDGFLEDVRQSFGTYKSCNIEVSGLGYTYGYGVIVDINENWGNGFLSSEMKLYIKLASPMTVTQGGNYTITVTFYGYLELSQVTYLEAGQLKEFFVVITFPKVD